MSTHNDSFEELDQYDYSDGEYLDTAASRYTSLIGSFLLNYSILEQDLNLAIADFVHDDSNELGYVIVEKLSVSNKIDLFYKMYVRLESFKETKNKNILDKIRGQLEGLNSFRNNLVHANWQSLTKEGYVRTRIVVDNQEGYVKFIRIQITPIIIRKKIKEIVKLSEQIDDYKESAFNF